jgi:hypothetical protein
MFTIKKYLHYKNTPDGKPRVLVEGDDYDQKTVDTLEKHDYKDGDCYSIGEFVDIIDLKDCRPLLSLEYKQKQELDIFNYFYPDNELQDKKWVDTNTYHLLSFVDNYWTISDFKLFEDNTLEFFPVWHFKVDVFNIEYQPQLQEPRAKFEKIGNFADNPAKYSKLLWDCTEEEGWEKVLKLLNI